MQTRSKTKESIIDFDEASREWKANKISKGNGTYRYVCCGLTKSGKKCTKVPTIFSDYCTIHQKSRK